MMLLFVNMACGAVIRMRKGWKTIGVLISHLSIMFMLAAGSLAAPQFLGGPSTLWFTSIVYDFFFQAFNWPRGAAYAFILLAACIAFVMLMLRLFKVSLGETIK